MTASFDGEQSSGGSSRAEPKPSRLGWLPRVVLSVFLALILAVGALWLLGPREPVDVAVTFDPAAIGSDPDAYLRGSEADVPNLRSNAAKEIVWAYPASKARTPLAIVYIHGFSGTKEELRPLPDDLARVLGANLFLTRLSGHGRNGSAMAEASVNDWVNDFAEAIAIGHRLGDRVVVVGMSTGATIAVLAQTLPEFATSVAANVLISPNFGVRDRRAALLTVPFARRLLPWLGDETYRFEPLGPEHAANWTTSFPATALLPMAAIVRAVRRADVERSLTPTFFIYSTEDRVVIPAQTEDMARRWGAFHATLIVNDGGDPLHHVLAGRIVSPGTTDRIAQVAAEWIRALPIQAAVRSEDRQ